MGMARHQRSDSVSDETGGADASALELCWGWSGLGIACRMTQQGQKAVTGTGYGTTLHRLYYKPHVRSASQCANFVASTADMLRAHLGRISGAYAVPALCIYWHA
jgi:hypothetical protein